MPKTRNFYVQAHPLLSALIAAALLTACGSAKDASNSNFAKAIDAHFAKHCIVINPGTVLGNNNSDAYPATIPLTIPNQYLSADEAAKRNDEKIGTYETLVKAGLLTVSDGQAKSSVSWTQSSSTIQEVPAKVYTLTEDGKKALRDQKDMKGTGFCGGYNQVDDIVRFTPPASGMMGATISTVIYTFSPTKVPAWVKSDDVIKAFPDLARQLAPKQKGDTDLVLASDGWIVASDFNK
jgi:DNA-binding PadR family transcriptional regulator